jgi:hypothetical protein
MLKKILFLAMLFLGAILHYNKHNLYFLADVCTCQKNRSVDYFKRFKIKYSYAIKKSKKAKSNSDYPLPSYQGPGPDSEPRTISSSEVPDRAKTPKAKARRLTSGPLSSYRGPAREPETIVIHRGVNLSNMGLMIF